MKSRLHLTTLKHTLYKALNKKIDNLTDGNPSKRDRGQTAGQMILSAPTGSGKTEAALLWSNNNQCETLGNRVFYVLPYTASINAMYKRLKKLVTKRENRYVAR